MINLDKEALECDMAETYGIFDLKSLPISKIAVLAKGLNNNSRIKKILTKTPCDLNTILLMSIADSLNWLVWSKTKDASKNKNKPVSLLRDLYKEKETLSLKSGKDFEIEREKIIKKIRKEVKCQQQN